MSTPGAATAIKIINGIRWAYLKRNTGRNILCRESEYDLYQALEKKAKVNFHSLYLHKQMMGLSADTGSFNNLFSRFSALKRKLQLPGGAVHYEMRDGEVLLTQLEIDWDYQTKNTAGMGLFTVRKEDKNWIPEPAERIRTLHATVNGTVDNIKRAANLMPGFINHGYPQARLGEKEEYALFYNAYNGPAQADWNCIQDSTGLRGGSQAARQLAAVIELAAHEKRAVNWTVHERGCAIWKQALRLVPAGHDYSKQTVFYANPVVNLELMDQHRKRLKMQLVTPLMNEMSLHQGMVAGNWVSEPVLLWQMGNQGGAVTKVASHLAKAGGMGTALALPGLVGAAAWAIGLAAMLGPNLFSHYSNQGIIKNSGDALNHYIFKRKK